MGDSGIGEGDLLKSETIKDPLPIYKLNQETIRKKITLKKLGNVSQCYNSGHTGGSVGGIKGGGACDSLLAM